MKIKSKKIYYLYVFYTICSLLITLAALVSMITSFVEPAVPVQLKMLTISSFIIFMIITFELLQSCLAYLIEEEKQKTK